MKKKIVVMLMVLCMVIATLSGCGSSSKSTANSSSGKTQTAKRYKIALSNSYMGNDWRQTMERVVQYVASQPQYKGRVDLHIINTDNTPEAQASSIDDLTTQGYDAILIDASSPTALNPAIQRAVNAGITVVSFDQPVTSTVAYTIQSDYKSKALRSAEYIEKSLNGKGNIILDRAIPGSPMSQDELNVATNYFKKYPGIKIVSEYDGEDDPGPSEQGVANALTANSQIDAVWTQGPLGAAIKAFKAAGRPVPIVTGGGYGVYNGDALTLLNGHYKGLIYLFDMPGIGAVAMKNAINILDKKSVPKHQVINDIEYFSNDTKIDIGAQIQALKEGVNCWTDKAPTFGWPVLPADFGVKITPNDVWPSKK